MKIYKEKSDDLGFVIVCLYSQAINLNELKKWVELCIDVLPQDKIPLYMFDLIDFDESLLRLHSTIGFVPSCRLSKKESAALEGIAYLRGEDVFDPIYDKDKSLKCLKNSPNILSRFKKMFPFIPLISVP